MLGLTPDTEAKSDSFLAIIPATAAGTRGYKIETLVGIVSSGVDGSICGELQLTFWQREGSRG